MGGAAKPLNGLGRACVLVLRDLFFQPLTQPQRGLFGLLVVLCVFFSFFLCWPHPSVPPPPATPLPHSPIFSFLKVKVTRHIMHTRAHCCFFFLFFWLNYLLAAAPGWYMKRL